MSSQPPAADSSEPPGLQTDGASNSNRHADPAAPEPSSSPAETSSSRSSYWDDLCDGSRVEYYGVGQNSCGYCKRDGTRSMGRRSYDMRAYKLTAADYQGLLDRGWRRSGSYCYHPVNSATCCPNYPIKCNALEFKLSRSQRRCIESMNNFLVHGSVKQKANIDYYIEKGNDDKVGQSQPINFTVLKDFERLKSSKSARVKRFVKSCERKVELYKIPLEEAIQRTKDKSVARTKRLHRNGQLEDYLFPKKRNFSKIECDKTATTIMPQPKHRLEIRLAQVKSSFSNSIRGEEHEILRQYQKEIHKEDDKWDIDRYSEFLVESPLVTEPLQNFDYICAETTNQVIDVGTFLRTDDNFSVVDPSIDPNDHPLVKPTELPTAFGTYHCSYHIDDKLVAVGVLDLLPECLTTVYFFYDPKYGFLNLGIYSALVEISIVRRMHRHFEGSPGDNKLIFYHMGYYVNECKKMLYKTRFRPSCMLCSETCKYVPTETCLSKLAVAKYARFSDDASGHSIYTEEVSLASMFEIPILAMPVGSAKAVDYVMWLQTNLGVDYANLFIENFLFQYIRLLGKSLAPRVHLQVNTVHRCLVERYERMTNSGPAAKSKHQKQDQEMKTESSQSESD